MTEFEQAQKIAADWLDGRMNSLTQMVPGDPDCDAMVLARQFSRLAERAVPKPSRLYAQTNKVRCCSSVSPCSHQQRFPGTVCETCYRALADGQRPGDNEGVK